MPQEMNVLCCYACNTYQVHIVKKSNKWQCKICGEKQSIRVVYFQGSGIDCRHQVQRLNSLRATKDERQSFSSPKIDGYGLDCTADDNDDDSDLVDHCQCPKRPRQSYGKWYQYLEPSTSSSSTNDDDADDDAIVETVNLASQENREFIQNLENLQCSSQSYSFPGTRTYSSSSDFQDSPSVIQMARSKTRTYPLTKRSRKVYEKLEKHWEAGEEEYDLQDLVSKTDFSSAASSSSTDKRLPSRWDKFLEDPKDQQNLRGFESSTRRSYSLPDTNICEKSSSNDRQDVEFEIEACSSKSRTYPSRKRSSEGCYKRNEYLISVEDDQEDSIDKNDLSTVPTSPFVKKLSSKCDELLENPKDEMPSNLLVENARNETSISNSTTNDRCSTKCNIFEDYENDLDLTIDF